MKTTLFPEAINRRETDNKMCKRETDNKMGKRKRTKAQTTIYKTLYRKLKIDQHQPH